MNQQERDYLRRKHKQLGDSYTCAFCRLWDGEGHEEVAYPCDVIQVLDRLEIEYGDGYDAGYEDGRKHGPESWV